MCHLRWVSVSTIHVEEKPIFIFINTRMNILDDNKHQTRHDFFFTIKWHVFVFRLLNLIIARYIIIWNRYLLFYDSPGLNSWKNDVPQWLFFSRRNGKRVWIMIYLGICMTIQFSMHRILSLSVRCSVAPQAREMHGRPSWKNGNIKTVAVHPIGMFLVKQSGHMWKVFFYRSVDKLVWRVGIVWVNWDR